MKIAIVGSRGFKSLHKIQELLETLPKDTVVISGGAAGPDTEGVRVARLLGMKTVVYNADWNNLTHSNAVIKTNKYGSKYDAAAGHRRNTLIVNDSDVIYAFWDGTSPGTRNTINQARKLGKEVVIISP